MTDDPDLLAEAERRGDLAETLVDGGWWPVVVDAETKRPLWANWPAAKARRRHFIDRALGCGIVPNIGLQTIGLVVIDLDETDAEKAEQLRHLALAAFGPTPLERRRPGTPKRAFVYRAGDEVASTKIGPVDIIAGRGHQFVAYGVHPSGSVYYWPEEGPEHVAAISLPSVRQAQVDAFRDLCGAITGEISLPARAEKSVANVRQTIEEKRLSNKPAASSPSGKARDGREKIMADAAWAAIGEAARRGEGYDLDALAATVWMRWLSKADPTTPKGSGLGYWSKDDARRKVGALLARPAKIDEARRSRATSGGTWTLTRKAALLAVIDRQFTPATTRVAEAIANFANKETGLCTASAHSIARVARTDRTTAAKARRDLIDAGFLIEKRRGRARRLAKFEGDKGGAGKATVVMLNPAALPADNRIDVHVGGVPAAVAPLFRERATASVANMVQAFDRKEDTARPDGRFATRTKNHQPPRSVTASVDLPAVAALPAPIRALAVVDLLGVVTIPAEVSTVVLGEAMARSRTEVGLTQRELAELIGTKQPHVANAERGHDRLGADKLSRLLAVLSCPPSLERSA